jgi:hypothetical protein
MRPTVVWLPTKMLRALRQVRKTEHIAMNEVVREAVAAWFERRTKGGRK